MGRSIESWEWIGLTRNMEGLGSRTKNIPVMITSMAVHAETTVPVTAGHA
jgi:hypothetical protein